MWVPVKASAGYLLRHPWQLALAVLGIVIGVAVIVAVDLANASARKAFVLSMDTITGEATHQVVGGPRGVDELTYVDLRVEHGIRNIAPVVEGWVLAGDQSLRLLGVDLFAEREVRSFTGRTVDLAGADTSAAETLRLFLTDPGAVTASRAIADRLGLASGDRFEIQAGGRAYVATLAGVFGDDDLAGVDNLLIADIATAQDWLDQSGWLTRIDVRIASDDGAALARLESALPDDARVLSAAGRTQTTVDLSAAFMTNLTAMSLLALLVGVFLIYNSVSFSVLQRRGLIGILRALGVTRAQVFALILSESALIGLIAAVLGVVAGIWLGERLLGLVTQSINDLYFRVTVTDISIDRLSIAKGLVAGVGAALLAAAVPAVEATSYVPRLAMTRSALEQGTRRYLPRIALGGVAFLLFAGLLLAVSGRNLVAGLTALFLLILGFALCVPLVVRGVTSALTPLAMGIGGTPARIAVAGVASNLSRTGVAIVALAVAVSATIGVSVMVDSFRGSVSEWLGQTLQADVYARVTSGSFDPSLLDDIAGIAGVEAYSTGRRAWLEDEAARKPVLAVRMAPGSYAGTEIIDADPEKVWPLWDRGDVVLVSESYAYMNDVGAGDSVSLPTDAGEKRFRIEATYRSFDVNASAILMSRSTYDRHWNDPGVDSIGLYLADHGDADRVIAEIASASAGRQQVEVNSNAGIREVSLEIFDRTFIITDVLYWLATGVALIGILGAMLALQLERARELGTLRALGMTPGQLGGMVTLQTSVIGLLSGLAAIPLGVVMAYVLIEVINRRAFGWQIEMAVATDILFSAVAFAIVTALFAGVYPAWRAAQSRPAIAMREE